MEISKNKILHLTGHYSSHVRKICIKYQHLLDSQEIIYKFDLFKLLELPMDYIERVFLSYKNFPHIEIKKHKLYNIAILNKYYQQKRKIKLIENLSFKEYNFSIFNLTALILPDSEQLKTSFTKKPKSFQEILIDQSYKQQRLFCEDKTFDQGIDSSHPCIYIPSSHKDLIVISQKMENCIYQKKYLNEVVDNSCYIICILRKNKITYVSQFDPDLNLIEIKGIKNNKLSLELTKELEIFILKNIFLKTHFQK